MPGFSLITRPLTSRTARALSGVAMSGLMIFGSASAASAAVSTKSTSSASSCTNNLMPSIQGTAQVVMTASGQAERGATSARLASATVRGAVLTCSTPSGTSEAASSITAQVIYTVTFAEVPSCNIGIPSGVSCQVVSKTIQLTESKTCKGTASCTVTWPSNLAVQSPNLGVPVLIQLKGVSTAKQGSKPSVSTSSFVSW